jgi:hypothetical protein
VPGIGLFLPRDGHKITLWNVDYGAMNTDKNLYGSHPFLLEVAADGTAHGVFIASSSGLEVTLDPEATTFRYSTFSFDTCSIVLQI